MTDMNLGDIVQEMEDLGILEDRTEYDIEDLKKGYDLDHETAKTLYMFLQVERYGLDWDRWSGDQIKDMIGEASHQGYDGYSRTEQITITAFLYDIVAALKVDEDRPLPPRK